MRTSNPALNDETFKNATFDFPVDRAANVMTLEGTAAKGLLLTGIVMVTGGASFYWAMAQMIAAGPTMVEQAGRIGSLSNLPGPVMGMILGGAIVGAILALVTIFWKQAAMFTSPLYAAAEGVFLGAFSTIFEYMYPGAVPVAVAITFGILFSLLAVYMTGLIKPSENFKLGIAAATGGIMLFYVASMVSRMFFGYEFPFLHETGWMGIGFSLFVVVIASLNLVLDFDFIENGVEAQAPKYMEWYAAFGLLVTLVWLYLEVLKLVVKIMAARRE